MKNVLISLMLCRVLVMAPDSAIAGCLSSANGLMKEVSPPAAFFPKIEHVQNILHFQNVMGHFMLHILDISSSCFSLVYGESPPRCNVIFSGPSMIGHRDVSLNKERFITYYTLCSTPLYLIIAHTLGPRF